MALVDLDGVVYVGEHAVPGAAAALEKARAAGLRVAYVTNNASRGPDLVAAHLEALGFAAAAADVVTSAQAAATLLARQLPPGGRVLVCGAPALAAEVAAAGLTVVASAAESPDAVVSGYDPGIDYARLAEAALAVRAGALWVASNVDATLPTPRGLLPGNGALVAAVATATGRRPVVAGKPAPALFQEAVRRTAARAPLVVGDRLDTDVAGAVAAGYPSLLVLTGVATAAAVLAAAPGERPTYVGADLGALVAPYPAVAADGGYARCRGWSAYARDGALALEGGGDAIDALRALAAVAWASGAGEVRAVGAAAERALGELGLAGGSEQRA